MTTKEALEILDQATQPANAGRISREGYWQTQEAISHLKDRLAAAEQNNARDTRGEEVVQ